MIKLWRSNVEGGAVAWHNRVKSFLKENFTFHKPEFSAQKFGLSGQNPNENCVFRIEWAMEMFVGTQVGKVEAFSKVYDQLHLSLTASTQLNKYTNIKAQPIQPYLEGNCKLGVIYNIVLSDRYHFGSKTIKQYTPSICITVFPQAQFPLTQFLH